MMRGMPSTPNLTAAVFAVGASAAALAAQQPIDARCFLVEDYRNIVRIDLAAMRKTVVWDDLCASGLRSVRKPLQQELGFPLEHLDRFSVVARLEDGEPSIRQRVYVLEGNAELAIPESIARGWQSEQISGHTVYQLPWFDGERFVRPHERLQVWGDVDLVSAGLAGGRRAALPSADVMSLVARRGAVLAYVVADLSAQESRNAFLEELKVDGEWPADDPPTFFAARLFTTGDEDDPHLVVEIVYRHAKVGAGIDVTEAAVERALQFARELQQLRLVRKVFEGAQKSRDGTDLKIRFDLGRTRDVFGAVGAIAVPLLMGRAARMQAVDAFQAVQIVVEEEVAEQPPAPPPVEREAGEGGGR